MAVARRIFGMDRDWIDELERLIDEIPDASPLARPALRATIESFRDDPETPPQQVLDGHAPNRH